MVEVEVEDRGRVRLVRINRPEAANSLNSAVISGIGRAFTDAEIDDRVRALVLTAAGERFFCAGLDLKAFARGESSQPDGPGLEVFNDRVYPKPVIAAVNGVAAGGGMELALDCDLVVSADHARWGLPEVRRGLIPGGVGSRLSRRIPIALALELTLTGELLDAERIAAMGLINRVVPASDLMTTALDLAEQTAANGPLAVAAVKKLLYSELGTRSVDFSELWSEVSSSEDATEGASAFAEKREPVFRGR